MTEKKKNEKKKTVIRTRKCCGQYAIMHTFI